jgi:hypothetical protein
MNEYNGGDYELNRHDQITADSLVREFLRRWPGVVLNIEPYPKFHLGKAVMRDPNKPFRLVFLDGPTLETVQDFVGENRCAIIRHATIGAVLWVGSQYDFSKLRASGQNAIAAVDLSGPLRMDEIKKLNEWASESGFDADTARAEGFEIWMAAQRHSRVLNKPIPFPSKLSSPN